MADKRVRHTWSVVGVILSTIRMTITLNFDISKIFPDFEKLNAVQKYVVAYGAKQILADSHSGKPEAEHKALMETKWNKLLTGDLSVHRTGFASFEARKEEAWAKANAKEQAILRKLGFAPKSALVEK